MQIYNLSTIKKTALCLSFIISTFGCSQKVNFSAVHTLSPVLIGPIKTIDKNLIEEADKNSTKKFSISLSNSFAVSSTPTTSRSSYHKEGSNKVDMKLVKAGLTAEHFAVVDKIVASSYAINLLIVMGTTTYISMSGKLYPLTPLIEY